MKCGEHFIKLMGLGGGGTNIANCVAKSFPELSSIVLDTDFASLQNSQVSQKILIGKNTTRSISSGSNAELAKSAISESLDDISNAISGTDLLFITSSFGGGTGTELSIVTAKIAKKAGAKVIAFCALPFEFEGEKKIEFARAKFEELRNVCDIAVALENDKLLENLQEKNIETAFSDANKCIASSIKCICQMLANTGLINTDFATLSNILNGSQNRIGAFSYGYAKGDDFAKNAISSFNKFPCANCDLNAKKADKLLVCARCSQDTSTKELKSVLINAASKFSNNENVVFGAIIDKEMSQEIEVFAIGLEFSNVVQEVKAEQESESVTFPKEHNRLYKPQVQRLRAKPKQNNDLQGEFDFVEDELERGYFESTPRNLYEGKDLDVPTFMRAQIKI